MKEKSKELIPKFKQICVKVISIEDRAERHDLKSLLWLFYSPFLFPTKKRGKKKRRINSKNRDFKSCLSARSL